MAATINADNGSVSGSAGLKSSADSSGVLALQTNGTTAVTVDASQNVGIGSTSPNIGGLTRALTINTPTGGNYSGVELAGAGTLSARFVTNNAAGTFFGSQLSIPLIFETNATEKARIDTSGNVGIGTTTPDIFSRGYGRVVGINDSGSSGAALEINSASSYAAVELGRGGVRKAFFTAQSTETELGNLEAVPLIFYTNSVQRARITSDGDLLVGTTSTGYTSSGSTYYSPSVQYWINNHLTGTSSGTRYIGFGIGTGEIGSITHSGTTAVLYNTTSDYRLKNDQQPLTGAKDFIMALKPKKWQWWDGSGEGVGFVAHEFMEVAKYSGNGTKDAVDSDGKPVYQSIQPSSSEVMANLVAFIQEQQALITQLQADVAALKGASA